MRSIFIILLCGLCLQDCAYLKEAYGPPDTDEQIDACWRKEFVSKGLKNYNPSIETEILSSVK
jgi:hypothetical protein